MAGMTATQLAFELFKNKKSGEYLSYDQGEYLYSLAEKEGKRDTSSGNKKVTGAFVTTKGTFNWKLVREAGAHPRWYFEVRKGE